jgi:hypothetical protein
MGRPPYFCERLGADSPQQLPRVRPPTLFHDPQEIQAR